MKRQDTALNDAVNDLLEINSFYQDIELILNDRDREDSSKITGIVSINEEIGKITAKWV